MSGCTWFVFMYWIHVIDVYKRRRTFLLKLCLKLSWRYKENWVHSSTVATVIDILFRKHLIQAYFHTMDHKTSPIFSDHLKTVHMQKVKTLNTEGRRQKRSRLTSYIPATLRNLLGALDIFPGKKNVTHARKNREVSLSCGDFGRLTQGKVSVNQFRHK